MLASYQMPLVVMLLLAGSTAAAQVPPTGAPAPVFFVPLQVDNPFTGKEKVLRALLTAGILGTGRFVESVTAETEQARRDCIREINSDRNAETCWIRLGQGQGASLMVTGEIRGTSKSCTSMLRLTALETRVAQRMRVQVLRPCGEAELEQEMRRAAWELAGAVGGAGPPSAGPAISTSGTASAPPLPQSGSVAIAPPPPEILPHDPIIDRGQVTAVAGNLAVEVRPYGQVRLDLREPSGREQAVGSPYRNPQAAVGEWQVVASAAGYEPTTRSVTVRTDETAILQLELRKLGTLGVDVQPREQVRLNLTDPTGASQTVGSPYSNPVALLGQWQIRASATGYEAATETVQVEPGEAAAVSLALVPLGGLEVSGEPVGAAVKVTGPEGFSDNQGGLPWSARGLTSGSYLVEVARTGYTPFTQRVVVRAGDTARIAVKLELSIPDRTSSAPGPAERLPDHWTGNAHQQDTNTDWTVDLRISKLEAGLRCAEIAYPSLSCTGYLECTSGTAEDEIVAREVITTGQSRCVDGGIVRVKFREQQATYEWRSTSQYATTVLYPIGSTTRQTGPGQATSSENDPPWLGHRLLEQSGWQVSLRIGCLDRGSRCGDIEFRSLNCGGSLRYEELSSDGYVFAEKLNYGNCVRGCKIIIARTGHSYYETCSGRRTGGGRLSY